MNVNPTRMSLCRGELEIPSAAVGKVRVVEFDETPPSVADSALGHLLYERFLEPLDFPPVLQSVIEDDAVVIALAPGTAHGPELALLTARALAVQGLSPEQISVLVVETESGLKEITEEGFSVALFDPNDESQRVWLTSGFEDVSIYVSRELFDADVIVPIGSFFGAAPRDTICPAFCDRETRMLLEQMPPAEADATINSINDNLGTFWQVNVLLTPGGEIFDIVVGERHAVIRECRRRLLPAWTATLPRPAPLVVAELDSDFDQTWNAVALALQLAERGVEREGAIALITRIDHPPPKLWEKGAAQGGTIPERDRNVADLLARRHVFLYSALKPQQVEGSAFAPIGDSQELGRLVERYGDALVLRSANQIELR